jgi:bacteriorhodopsin
MNILEKMKSPPWGLKIIVLLFGIEMVRNVIEAVRGPEPYKVVNSIIAVLFFVGFLLRWEAVRFVWRLLSCAFFFIIFYYVLLGEQFDLKQKAFAIASMCISGAMFLYLGRPGIRTLFK